MRPSVNDCWLPTAAFASSSSQWPALLPAKCLLCCKRFAFGKCHWSRRLCIQFQRRLCLCQAAGFAFLANGSQWQSEKAAAGRWVEEEAGEFSSPTVARGGSGRCVSACTREGSKQPLPLHPAICLRRMCWVVAASGPAWQSYWLLPLLLLLLLLPLAKKAICRFACLGGCKQMLKRMANAKRCRPSRQEKAFCSSHWPLAAAAAAAAAAIG